MQIQRECLSFSLLPEKELDWSDKGVRGIYKFLVKLFSLVQDNKSALTMESLSVGIFKAMKNMDKNLVSRTSRAIKKTTEFLEKNQHSLAIGAIMELANILFKYAATENISREAFSYAVKNIALLLSPFAPHLAEEIWHIIGFKSFVSIEKWPEYSKELTDNEAEAAYDLIQQTRKDIIAVMGLIKIKSPKKITLFTADEWKYGFLKMLKKELEKTRDTKEIISAVMSTDYKKYGKEAIKLAAKTASKSIGIVLDKGTEDKIIKENIASLEKEFNCPVVLGKGSENPKSKNALPGKPAILIE